MSDADRAAWLRVEVDAGRSKLKTCALCGHDFWARRKSSNSVGGFVSRCAFCVDARKEKNGSGRYKRPAPKDGAR